MLRLASAGALLSVVMVTLSPGDATPRLPMDTLPEKLAIDHIPAGLSRERPIPKDNPLTDARVRLGRKLFFDPILSADRTVACATCHDPAHAFAGKDAVPKGVHGKSGRRNAPSLWNRAYAGTLFWDGRAATLEAQALKPIADPAEMGGSIAEAVRRLRIHPHYPDLFKEAFGDGVTPDNLAKALASFQRALLLGNSRVDRFRILLDAGVLTAQERHGLWLWESKAQCWRCHSGPNFTDEQFHNTGVSWGKEPLDLGRYEVTRLEFDKGKFKTPSLRGVAHTAPYMHDGSLATLEDVLDYYNRGGRKNPYVDPVIRPLDLAREEMQSLTAFLRALSEGAIPGK